MFAWEETLISVSNESDHEHIHSEPKQVGPLLLSSPGRYVIMLERTPLTHSHD